MKKTFISVLVILTLLRVDAFGRESIPSTEKQLVKLFSRLSQVFADSDRLRINDSIKVLAESYIYSDSIFLCNLSSVRYLGQVTSPDSEIKIVSWNLPMRDSPGKYFSYIIKRSGARTKAGSLTGNRVYPLSAEYREEQCQADSAYDGKNWYGSLYYDIRPCSKESGKCWIILGIDYGNKLVTRKIIDVLTFSDDDIPVFGKKWFDDGKALHSRVVLTYGSGGVISLRFNSEKMIVFDHLAPYVPSNAGDQQFFGADYSFDAYRFDGEKWKLEINVDVRNKEVKPGNVQIIRQK